MTFTEIVTEVAARLNLTSTEATTRIGRVVNDRYKRVTSTIGLVTSRRDTVQANATLGDSEFTFSGVEKLINVVDRSSSPYRVLREVTVEELRGNEPTSLDSPTSYAILSTTATTVTILLDCVPQSAFTLYADGHVNATTLSGTNKPVFAESFHDILLYGTLADEYRKLMKLDYAKESEMMYERRLSDLRMYSAKSSYLDIMQGGTKGRLLGQQAPGAGGGSGTFNGAQSWTQTGLVTFNRGALAPFAVVLGAAKVTNLDADFLDGHDSTYFAIAGAAPALHATTHKSGGSDVVKLDELGAPTDVATLNASTTAHGLLKKLSNVATEFMNGVGNWATPSSDPAVCNGRLTLTTGVPVTTADVSAAGTLYFTPYKGNLIGTYSGSAWTISAFTEKSVAVPAVANQMYDVFIVDSTLALELVAWTNDTTRATALTLQDGIYVKTGATTRRYLGSFRTLSASQTESSITNRMVWNYYNRVLQPMVRIETTATWTYTTATIRQANASTANTLKIVQGVAEDEIDLFLAMVYSNSSAAYGQVFIGEDSTTVPATNSFSPPCGCAASSYAHVSATLRKVPTAGYHAYNWLEWSLATGTATWYGGTGAGWPGSVPGGGFAGTVRG